MKNKLTLILLSSILFGMFCYLYINRSSQNYYETREEFSFENSKQFIDLQSEYLSKVVSIKGVVTNLTFSSPYLSIVLNDNLHFSFEIENNNQNIQFQDTVIIKGRYEGFDELFEQYSFTNCRVLE